MKKNTDRQSGRRYRLQDDGSLAWLFFHTVRKMRSFNYTGYSQQLVLNILDENGSMNQKELQDILEVKAGSLSELLAKLEDKGLIERKKDVRDRRNVIVMITEEGRNVKKEISLQKDRVIFGALSDEERQMLRQILNRLSSQQETSDFIENIHRKQETL